MADWQQGNGFKAPVANTESSPFPTPEDADDEMADDEMTVVADQRLTKAAKGKAVEGK